MRELPAHRSFSQLSTFLRCQHQYYLSKVQQVPETPAVYLAAGNAVHSMIEQLNHDLYGRMQDV
jgi:ATP-dependent helicase/DNAse subunit B